MKPTWLDRALVEAPFCYTLATDETLFHKALRHLFESGAKLTYVVCIRSRDGMSMPQVAALVTHEAVHMWQTARERLGERSPSTEFEAYAIQALTQRLLEEYERQVKK